MPFKKTKKTKKTNDNYKVQIIHIRIPLRLTHWKTTDHMLTFYFDLLLVLLWNKEKSFL